MATANLLLLLLLLITGILISSLVFSTQDKPGTKSTNVFTFISPISAVLLLFIYYI